MKLIWRIVLTENCNANCAHCFNSGERHGRQMDVKKLEELILQNRSFCNKSSLYIMGGEPTLHKDIKRVIELGLTYFNNCTLFTNGIRMNRLLQDNDIVAMILKNWQRFGITINGLTFDYKDFNRWKKYVDTVAIHCVINEQNYSILLDKIRQTSNDPQIIYSLSVDTTVNIFDEDIWNDYRELLIMFYKEVYSLGIGKEISSDHRLPYCKVDSKLLSTFNYFDRGKNNFGCKCSIKGELGLILPDFTLNYCNQTNIPITKLFFKNGKPKDGIVIQEDMYNARMLKKQAIIKKSPKCKNCPALEGCLVGCYYNTLVKT